MYLINTVHKQIGIEARRGHKGKYFTRCGFNRDQRAAPAGERAFSSLLQTAIQGESQTIPRRGRAAPERAHLDAGKAETLHYKARHFGLSQMQTNRKAVERF